MIQQVSTTELSRILSEINNIKKAAWTCLEEKPATRNVTEISAKMDICKSGFLVVHWYTNQNVDKIWLLPREIICLK